MKFNLSMTLNDDDSLSLSVENPADISLYQMVGYLEKVKTEILLASPGPDEMEEKDGSALDSAS